MSLSVGFHDLFNFIKIGKAPGDFVDKVKAHGSHESYVAKVDEWIRTELTLRHF